MNNVLVGIVEIILIIKKVQLTTLNVLFFQFDAMNPIDNLCNVFLFCGMNFPFYPYGQQILLFGCHGSFSSTAHPFC